MDDIAELLKTTSGATSAQRVHAEYDLHFDFPDEAAVKVRVTIYDDPSTPSIGRFTVSAESEDGTRGAGFVNGAASVESAIRQVRWVNLDDPRIRFIKAREEVVMRDQPRAYVSQSEAEA